MGQNKNPLANKVIPVYRINRTYYLLSFLDCFCKNVFYFNLSKESK